MPKYQDNKRYPKQRKPIYALILEGRNKTEKLYFNHFNTRQAPYILKLISAEDTDPMRMAAKADYVYKDFDMSKDNGDEVFCLIDVDLSNERYGQIVAAKKKYKNVSFILSNPCFEVWLLYYFTENPRVVSSSQKVKDELRKFVPNYTENIDIVAEKHLQDKYAVAINRAEKRQSGMQENSVVDKNPFTEVNDLITLLVKDDCFYAG